MDTCQLFVLGCGAANCAAVQALMTDPAIAERISRLDTVDCQLVREVNLVTCPQYQGHVGQAKGACLRELASTWAGRPLAGQAWNQPIETLAWERLVGRESGRESGGPPGGRRFPKGVLVLSGLDDWSARLMAMSDLRRLARTVPDEIVVIQTALDQGQASINVFGAAWEDPCPACGLWTLPEPVPCVVAGGAVRGHLRAEAQAAAAQVQCLVREILAGELERWKNRKVSLQAEGQGFRSFVTLRRHMSGCWGPHRPATPFGPEDFLEEVPA